MATVSTTTRVRRVRHELKRRDVEVVRVGALGPNFRSITFAGEALADFISESFDDHVKFIIDAEKAEPVRRDYTPRSFDRASRELMIEFSLHGDGPAARWTAQAKPGQRATIGGPRGSMIIPVEFDRHLLVGDETALPAMARRLEELPAAARIAVIGRVDDPTDRRLFASAASVEVQWVTTDTQMTEAVRSLSFPPGEGYVWCAGEAAAMVALRRVLAAEKGHDRHAPRAAAYWKRGAVAHHENLED